MHAGKCVLKVKQGIAELDRTGVYAVVANRTLYECGKAHKFAVVNAQKARVDSVHRSYREARSTMLSLSQSW